MKKALMVAVALVLALATAVWLVRAPKAAAQGTTYACVIASMGKQIFYRGGFASWSNCMAFCSYNANIRSWGGQLEIRYNCPPERW